MNNFCNIITIFIIKVMELTCDGVSGFNQVFWDLCAVRRIWGVLHVFQIRFNVLLNTNLKTQQKKKRKHIVNITTAIEL